MNEGLYKEAAAAFYVLAFVALLISGTMVIVKLIELGAAVAQWFHEVITVTDMGDILHPERKEE